MFSVSVATEVTMMRYEIQYERLAGVIAIYRTLVWVDLHGEIPGSLFAMGSSQYYPSSATRSRRSGENLNDLPDDLPFWTLTA